MDIIFKIKRMNIFMMIFTFFIILIFAGCDNNISDNSTETNNHILENSNIEELVDNNCDYTSKIYSKNDILFFYIPYSMQSTIFSPQEWFNVLIEKFNIKFLRKSGEYYYTFLKMEDSKLYIFLDDNERIISMLNIPNKFIDKNDFVTKVNFNEILDLDKSAIIVEYVPKIKTNENYKLPEIMSEHILEDGETLCVTYNKQEEKYIVEHMSFHNDSKKFIDLIIEKDR